MKKVLKFSTERQNIWFSSDSHFKHSKEFIYKPRGFSSVEQHDKTLIENWNNKVAADDIVVFLGDFSLNSSEEETKCLFNSLRGNIYYVFGNHESYVYRIYRNEILRKYGDSEIEVYPITWNNKVTFVGNDITLSVDKQLIYCSHWAHRTWDKMQHGIIHLCGHSHSNDIESQPDYLGCKRLDCGVDNFGCPVSFQDVMKIMDKKSIKVVDHHDGDTVSGR